MMRRMLRNLGDLELTEGSFLSFSSDSRLRFDLANILRVFFGVLLTDMPEGPGKSGSGAISVGFLGSDFTVAVFEELYSYNLRCINLLKGGGICSIVLHTIENGVSTTLKSCIASSSVASALLSVVSIRIFLSMFNDDVDCAKLTIPIPTSSFSCLTSTS